MLGKKGELFPKLDALIAGNDMRRSLQNSSLYPILTTYGPLGIWRFLQGEHLWVYKRMNNRLRSRFDPYFSYYEINTLIICLRYLAGRQDQDAVSHELQASLLHYDIHAIMTGGHDFRTMLQALELRLCSYSKLFKGLGDHYENKGHAALETFLRDRFFATIFSRKLPPRLKYFFQYLVDLHNSMAVAKSIRWKTATEPTLILGGTVPLDRFKNAYNRKNLSQVLKFLRLRDLGRTESASQTLETTFLRGITGKLKCWSYQRTVNGNILFYLWEQYRYARNISMVLYTVPLSDGKVRENIIL